MLLPAPWVAARRRDGCLLDVAQRRAVVAEAARHQEARRAQPRPRTQARVQPRANLWLMERGAAVLKTLKFGGGLIHSSSGLFLFLEQAEPAPSPAWLSLLPRPGWGPRARGTLEKTPPRKSSPQCRPFPPSVLPQLGTAPRSSTILYVTCLYWLELFLRTRGHLTPVVLSRDAERKARFTTRKDFLSLLCFQLGKANTTQTRAPRVCAE